MLEKMENELREIEKTPPWMKRTLGRRNFPWEGVGAPEPGEYARWQQEIQNRKAAIAEEYAKRMINRP